MPYPVTYYCPHCGAIHELQREGYLADKSVTPYPLKGWDYGSPDQPFEDESGVDGVRFLCGENDDRLLTGEELPAAATAPDSGCGEPFYLSFVRFEDGNEVQPKSADTHVTIGVDSHQPNGPDSPSGPTGPSSN